MCLGKNKVGPLSQESGVIRLDQNAFDHPSETWLVDGCSVMRKENGYKTFVGVYTCSVE